MTTVTIFYLFNFFFFRCYCFCVLDMSARHRARNSDSLIFIITVRQIMFTAAVCSKMLATSFFFFSFFRAINERAWRWSGEGGGGGRGEGERERGKEKENKPRNEKQSVTQKRYNTNTIIFQTVQDLTISMTSNNYCLSRSVPEIHWHVAGTVSNQCLQGYNSTVTNRNVREQVSVYWNILGNILRFVL